MAFSRTVSALIRTGHLTARVQDDTLNELVGVSPDVVAQLRAGDLDVLASRIGGQIAVLSLPDAETARVSASRYDHDPVVAAEDTHPSGIHADQTSKIDKGVA
jgi:predicted transcriptional regulator